MESRPHSSAGNKNKWAPSSSVVESRNKARELSRALERAATDLKAIDRQFQLLDSGLLSEEELKKFAGKSFFQKNTTPKRFQYLDAAETRQKRMNHEEHVVQKQLAARQRNKGGASSSPSRSNPPSPVRRQHLHSKSPVRLNKIEHSSNRPISPYAISNTNTNTNTTKSSSPSSSSFPPSSRGSSVALSNIRDERVEETPWFWDHFRICISKNTGNTVFFDFLSIRMQSKAMQCKAKQCKTKQNNEKESNSK